MHLWDESDGIGALTNPVRGHFAPAYFDRQADVVLSGSTVSAVIYCFAHIPLLMALPR